jgi:uncharacterized membrane protein YidH (DUF202 family)
MKNMANEAQDDRILHALVQLAEEKNRLTNNLIKLAEKRTELAIIRTGVALVALGIALARYFGFGYWTVFDGLLILGGAASAIYSTRSYVLTHRIADACLRKLGPLFNSLMSETSDL